MVGEGSPLAPRPCWDGTSHGALYMPQPAFLQMDLLSQNGYISYFNRYCQIAGASGHST